MEVFGSGFEFLGFLGVLDLAWGVWTSALSGTGSPPVDCDFWGPGGFKIGFRVGIHGCKRFGVWKSDGKVISRRFGDFGICLEVAVGWTYTWWFYANVPLEIIVIRKAFHELFLALEITRIEHLVLTITPG